MKRLGIEADQAVAMRSSSPDRWIIALELSGALVAVAKCGPIDDVGLRREGELLRTVVSRDPWVQLPELLIAEEVDGKFAVVTKVAPPRIGRVPLDEIGQLATLLTNGVLGEPLVHGDLAQWNVIRSPDQVWLVDWEHSRRARRPLWDLANHLCREAKLLSKYTPRQVVAHLVDEDSVGWNHLRAIDEDPRGASKYLGAYLDDCLAEAGSDHGFELKLRRCLK